MEDVLRLFDDDLITAARLLADWLLAWLP